MPETGGVGWRLSAGGYIFSTSRGERDFIPRTNRRTHGPDRESRIAPSWSLSGSGQIRLSTYQTMAALLQTARLKGFFSFSKHSIRVCPWTTSFVTSLSIECPIALALTGKLSRKSYAAGGSDAYIAIGGLYSNVFSLPHYPKKGTHAADSCTTESPYSQRPIQDNQAQVWCKPGWVTLWHLWNVGRTSDWQVTSQKPHKKHTSPTKHHSYGGGAARPSSGVDLINPCRLRGGRPCTCSFLCRHMK